MAWHHRITFKAMWEAVWLLKDQSDKLHAEARSEPNPALRKKLHDEADRLNVEAEALRVAYHERQEGKPNRD